MKGFQHWTVKQPFSCNRALLYMSSLLFFTAVVRNWNPEDIETFVVSLRHFHAEHHVSTSRMFCMHLNHKSPQHAALADFPNVLPRNTFLSILSSCKFMSCIDSGKRRRAVVRLTWVGHRIYNYEQCTAMSYTNDIMKHQKYSETLSSQLQCSGSKVWKYFTPLAIYLPAAYQLAALQSM